jgi:predicted Zn-dependent peptidase
VLGTEESISALRAAAVRDYYRSNYETPRLVVAAAGNLEHLAVTDLVGKAFAGARGATPDAEPAATRRGDAQLTAPAGRLRVLDRPTEQANIVLGTIGLSRFDDRRFALGVLNNAFGGGMSSRLFQEIREQRGLAYSVYSYTSQYADTGLFGVYVGCAPARVAEVLDLVRTEMTKVVDSGLSDDEVARGKGQLKGSLVLDLEDSASRMSRIGKSELVYGELLEVDELLARIDAVTADDIRAIAADVFTRQLALGVVGPFADADQFGALVG